MPTSSHCPKALHIVSPPVAAYVEATNSCDLGFLTRMDSASSPCCSAIPKTE